MLHDVATSQNSARNTISGVPRHRSRAHPRPPDPARPGPVPNEEHEGAEAQLRVPHCSLSRSLSRVARPRRLASHRNLTLSHPSCARKLPSSFAHRGLRRRFQGLLVERRCAGASTRVSVSGLRPRFATLAKITDPGQKQSGTSGFMLELSDTEIPASFGASRASELHRLLLVLLSLSAVFGQ
jgi:hypothetical protein